MEQWRNVRGCKTANKTVMVPRPGKTNRVGDHENYLSRWPLEPYRHCDFSGTIYHLTR